MSARVQIDALEGFISPADDLGQLKLVDAAAVLNLAQEINKIDTQAQGKRKLTIVLATGGTLAMRSSPDGVRTPALDVGFLIEKLPPELHDHFMVQGLQLFNVDSAQMSYQHSRELAIVMTYLYRHIRIPFTGFLVMHGTDTMSYGAAAMSLMMGQGLPFSIVYTGAQRPIEEPLSDAPTNIRNALYTLESLYLREMAEVLIVMGDRAMLATSSEKVDDASVNAFAAPRHQYVAQFTRMDYPVQLATWLKPRRSMPFEPTIIPGDYGHTLVIKSTLGYDPTLVERQVAIDTVRAVVLYSYGAGTVHERLLSATMKAASLRDIPVFIVNPVHSGYRVEYLSNQKAIEAGAIPLDMTLSATLAKIEIALRLHGHHRQLLADFMTESYVGEVPSHDSRFVR
ncbi:MAG: asparaginase [Alphaproteobacteria bacterium]|nr:asparaginase [Alphaproteobacteria bacterium]